MGDTGYLQPIVQTNVATKARPPHRLLLVTFPGKVCHNLSSLTTDRLPPEVYLWEGNTCPKARCASPVVILHSASVTGIPFRHVRSKHSVAMKVAILFAYIQCRVLAGETVVSTCKLIYLTLFML